ncbi:MAG: hypothetical protein AAB500_00345 [Patescibacteria group bacterium]
MSQREYLKIVERELQRINKVIDLKILRGEDYAREARDHKILLKKVRYSRRQSFFQNLARKIFPSFAMPF